MEEPKAPAPEPEPAPEPAPAPAFDTNSYANALTPNLRRLSENYTKSPAEADSELFAELEHAIELRLASEQTDAVLGERRMLEAIHARDQDLLKQLVVLDQNKELNVNPNAVIFTGAKSRAGRGPQPQAYFCSPAHYCVRTRDIPIPLLEALLAGGGHGEHRLNLNARDSEGNAPLHFAAAFGRADVVQWLLRHGANPTVQNAMGDTPLHVAVKARQQDTARALLDDERVDEALRMGNNDFKTPPELGLTALLEQPPSPAPNVESYVTTSRGPGVLERARGDVPDAGAGGPRGQGGQGELEIMLTWENTNDLDLHLQCPNGEHIFYKHKRAHCGGELEAGREIGLAIDEFGRPLLDQTGNQQVTRPKGDSVERIHWPRGREPPRGIYEVAVHQFALQTIQTGPRDSKETLQIANQTPYYLVIKVRGKIVWEYRGQIRLTKEKQLLREFEWPWDEAYECQRPVQMRSFLSLTGRGRGFDVPPFVHEFTMEGVVEPRPARPVRVVRTRPAAATAAGRKGGPQQKPKHNGCSVM